MDNRTITLDNIKYSVDQFSDDVKHLVFIHNKFTGQLQDAQLEVMKIQAALNQVSEQLSQQMRTELAEKAKPDYVDESVEDKA